jgi:type I restriction-modification system DNA methylase subunit
MKTAARNHQPPPGDCTERGKDFMNDNASSIISKVWSFCNTLRDDGVGYGDYLEQLTYLLFLKLADEFSRPRFFVY